MPPMSDLTISHPETSASWPIIGAVIGAMSVFTLTLGLSYPLLALILENLGTPKALIGLNAAMTPLGIILSSPAIPRLARYKGSWGLAMLCLLFTLLFFVLIGATRRIEFWFILRFLLGVCINGMFIVSETWINQLSHSTTRGRIMGIYATVMSLGFCVGPFILPLTGFDGWPPFMVGIVCFIAAGLIMLPLRRRLPEFEKTIHGSVYRFMTLAPTLLLAVLSAAYFDQIVLSFLPLYTLYFGFPQTTASFALGVLIVGNVFLQFPLGWLADLTSRRMVMLACTITTLAGCALLPFAIQSIWLLWPLLFIWGGAAFGVYTVALAGLGDRYSGAMLLTGSAAFGLMWGVGGMIGPALAGGAMQLWGPVGLPLILGIPFALFTFMLLWRHF
ncbi:MAG: MFS transporter [Desulfobacterales bacterium]|nr:MFS transporter [Desulfobacterales bacterium]